jgi:hypothetical protein
MFAYQSRFLGLGAVLSLAGALMVGMLALRKDPDPAGA